MTDWRHNRPIIRSMCPQSVALARWIPVGVAWRANNLRYLSPR